MYCTHTGSYICVLQLAVYDFNWLLLDHQRMYDYTGSLLCLYSHSVYQPRVPSLNPDAILFPPNSSIYFFPPIHSLIHFQFSNIHVVHLTLDFPARKRFLFLVRLRRIIIFMRRNLGKYSLTPKVTLLSGLVLLY